MAAAATKMSSPVFPRRRLGNDRSAAPRALSAAPSTTAGPDSARQPGVPQGELLSYDLVLDVADGPGEELFAVAGIWRDTAEWGPAYSMVMTEACIHVQGVHDRMPVILARDSWADWLDGPLRTGSASVAVVSTGSSVAGWASHAMSNSVVPTPSVGIPIVRANCAFST